MMIKLVLAAMAIATTAPALAAPDYHKPTAQDFRDGTCTRQQVRTPAGKIVHNPPIVRCGAPTVARRTSEQAETPASLTPAASDGTSNR